VEECGFGEFGCDGYHCCTPICQCSSWQFAADQDTEYLIINPLVLPEAWTIEAWVRLDNDTNAGSDYFFSFASAGDNNCALLRATGLQLGDWTHVAMTSSGVTYWNGVASTNGVYATWCGDVAGSFAVNVDQDNIGGALEGHQATPMSLNSLAIFSESWNASVAAAAAASGCNPLPTGAGAWAYFSPSTDGQDALGQVDASAIALNPSATTTTDGPPTCA